MELESRLRSWMGLVGMLALASAACGDGDKKDPAEEGGNEVDGGMEPAGERPPTGVDAGRNIDANLPPPIYDGGDASADADGTVPLPPVTTPDAGPPPPKPRLADGTPLAVCYQEADCISDDLTCVSSEGAEGAGFCMDDCNADRDCKVVGGVQSTCSGDGQCRFDCTGSGAGDGPCPPDMICRDIDTSLLAPPLYRCTFPLGSGIKSVASYGECNVSHGDGDCAGTGVCHVPVAGLITTGGFGPGYCAPTCTQDADCVLPAGTVATAVCDRGTCELDCSGKGSVCPTGLDCRDVDESPILTEYRCRVIN